MNPKDESKDEPKDESKDEPKDEPENEKYDSGTHVRSYVCFSISNGFYKTAAG